MSTLTRLPVYQGCVLNESVIPDDDGALLPLDTNMEIGTPSDVLVQEIEDGVGLFLFEANDFASNCF